MKQKAKIFLILLLPGMLFIPLIFVIPNKPYFFPYFYEESKLYIDELIQFTLSNLRDNNSEAFIRYQLSNKSYNEEGLRIYSSLNIWSYFAFTEVSKYKNNIFYRENYAIPAFNFVLNNLLNDTLFGVLHWCYPDGSFPPPANQSLFNDSKTILTTYQSWWILSLLDRYEYENDSIYLDYANKSLDFLITTLWDPINYGFYFDLSSHSGVINTKKDTWSQTNALEALLKAYKITNNQSYLFYINKTVDFLIN
ncbi:MAG: hypothetical protein ACFFDN_26780, partial [Candidatus Hodarchaeota archaeon]